MTRETYRSVEPGTRTGFSHTRPAYVIDDPLRGPAGVLGEQLGGAAIAWNEDRTRDVGEGEEPVAVPASKAELLEAIEKTFSKLDEDLDRVPENLVREPALEGHAKETRMSPADLVAYLVGWNQQVLTWHQRRDEGLPDEFPAEGIKWNELGLLAQRFYAEHTNDEWDSLRRQLREARDAIARLIETKSDEELYGSPWYGKWTMGRMISFNTSSPYANARKRIRAWLREL